MKAALVSKLQRRFVILGVAVVAGVGGLWIGRATSDHSTTPAASAVPNVSAVAALSVAPPPVFDMEEDPNFKTGFAMRPMDREILIAIKTFAFTREQMQDVLPGHAYRVRLIGSYADHRIGFVAIDLNRTGSWDERWEIVPGDVKRHVIKDPTAGGQPVTYTLRKGRWQPH